MKYKVILWDFDGTLAYTSKDVWNSLEYAAEKLSGKFSEDFKKYDNNLSKSMEEIFKEIYPYPGDDKYEEFDELVSSHYRYCSDYEDTYLYKGIYETLQLMKENNVINFIITMKPHEALERILEKREWKKLFDGWLSPDSISGNEKTKTEMIYHVMQMMRYENEEYIYIGDSWSDVFAAHNNDIECIGVTYGDGDEKLLKEMKPKYCIDNASDIGKIIKEGV